MLKNVLLFGKQCVTITQKLVFIDLIWEVFDLSFSSLASFSPVIASRWPVVAFSFSSVSFWVEDDGK